jgi:hypothetical protein
MRVAVGWYQLCSVVWRSRVQTSSRIRDILAEMFRDCPYARKSMPTTSCKPRTTFLPQILRWFFPLVFTIQLEVSSKHKFYLQDVACYMFRLIYSHYQVGRENKKKKKIVLNLPCSLKSYFYIFYQHGDGYILAETCSRLYLINNKLCWACVHYTSGCSFL